VIVGWRQSEKDFTHIPAPDELEGLLMAICSKRIMYIPPSESDNGYRECCGRFFVRAARTKSVIVIYLNRRTVNS
jgi:hypothetical protein